MIAVSSDFKTAVKGQSRYARSYIEISSEALYPDEAYPGQSYPGTYSDSISDSDYLVEWTIADSINLGRTTMRSVSITTLSNYNLANKEIDIYGGITLPDNSVEYVCFGTFVIDSTKTSNTGLETTFTGYDYMYYTQKDYTTAITGSTTVLDIVQEICTNTGLVLGTTDFYNYDLVIDSMPDTTDLTYRDVLKWVSELSLTFVKIGVDNKLYFKQFEDSLETVSADHYYDLSLEDKYGPINGVYLKSYKVGDTISATDSTSVSLNGETKFEINGNDLLEGIRDDVVSGMLTQINGTEYYPFEASWMNWLYLETGDIITLDDINDISYSTVILEQEIVFNGALSGSLINEAETTTTTEYSGNTTISNLEARKVGSDEIVSKINVSTEEITIQSSKISLEGYTTINDGFSVDLNGNMTANDGTFNGDIYLANGGQIVGSNGLLTNLQYSTGELTKFGFYYDINTDTYIADEQLFSFNIPSNFTVTDAKITIQHIPYYLYDGTATEYFWGYAREVKAYTQAITDIAVTGTLEGQANPPESVTTEISGAFGTNGWTATVPTLSAYDMEYEISNDISSSINTGLNLVVIKSDKTVVNDFIHTETRIGYENSGYCKAYLDIIGYYDYD